MKEDNTILPQKQTNEVKILEAAKVLFGRFGFRKTTVDELADYAGIAKSTMYRVFDSKEEILAELVVFEARAFRRSYMDRIQELDGPLEKIEALCRWTSDYFNSYPFLGRVMADDKRFFTPFLSEEVSFVEDGIRELISSLLEEGVEQEVFRPMDTNDATEAILVLMRKFAYHQYTVEEDENSEWVTFVLNAVKAYDLPPDSSN